MLNGPGFVNLMWMFVGVWMGLFLAGVVPAEDSESRAASPISASHTD